MAAKKKKWYQIVAPEAFGNKIIGETITADPESLSGRTIESSVTDLTKDMSRFFVRIKFRVRNVEDSRCFTEFFGAECNQERIYRMVQRRRKKVEAIQDIKTKDGVPVRLKTILTTTRSVNTSIKDRLRDFTRKSLEKEAAKLSLDEFVNKFIKADFQKSLKKGLKNIYPVADVEIRKIDVLR